MGEAERMEARQRAAAETLELGRALFDALIEAAAHPVVGASSVPEGAGESASEPFPEQAVRAAADELFRVLRVLLEVESEQES